MKTPAGPSLQQQPQTWDAVAPTYAEDVVNWLDWSREGLRAAPPRAGDRVLDVATGPGTLAFEVAKTAARVDAVDFSPGMIAEVTARAARDGVKNVEGAVMDARRWRSPTRRSTVCTACLASSSSRIERSRFARRFACSSRAASS